MLWVPPIAAITYMLRAERDGRWHSGPLGTFVLPMGWALAILVGAALCLRHEPACTASQFDELHLTCEMGSGV